MKKFFILPSLSVIMTLLLAACDQAAPQTDLVAPGETTVAINETGVPATQTLENDFSGLTFTRAFEEMFATVSSEYAFNGVAGKQPTWDTLHARILPLVQQAEQAGDVRAYFLALREFTLAFKDGHVNLGGGDLQVELFQSAIEGGYGFAVRELDDGRVLVSYVNPAGPAREAGIQVGAQLLEFNDLPISAAIDAVSIWGAPPSTASLMRYQKSRYLLRAPVGTQVAITFTNSGDVARTVTLTSIKENDSFAVTSIFLNYNSQSLPVESSILPSGIGYIKLSSTSDNRENIETLFKSALENFQTAGILNVVIDLRVVVNLAAEPVLPIIGLAGFLTDQEIILGQFHYLDKTTGQFETKGDLLTVQPRPDQYQFSKLILLIGPGCSYACELEAYALSKVHGMIVVGQSPSAGVLSDIRGGQYLMPGGITLQIPTGRFVGPGGEILLEGQGLSPTVRVPLDENNVLSLEDIVLDAAVAIATGR